jgi:hypothetical protein
VERLDSQEAPRGINLAAQFLYASAILVLVLTLVVWIGWLTFPLNGQVLVTNLLTAALLAFTANRIRKRKKWARWLFAAFYTIGTLLGIVAMLLSPELWQLLAPAAILSTLVQTALQTAALVLVFTPSANSWFRFQSTSEGSAV